MLRRYIPAVLDQLASAGTSFLVVILVARAVGSAEFGIFAITYACIVLVLLVHHAFFCEAYIVFFSRDSLLEGGVFRYLYHRHMAVVLGTVVLLSCALAARHLLGLAEAVVRALSILFALAALATLQLCRRASYTRRAVAPAAVGSVVHLAVAVSVAYVALTYSEGGELESAFAALGFGATTGAFTVRLLRRNEPKAAVAAKSALKEPAYWKYGWNAALAAVLGWVPANVYYLVLSAAQGLGEAGIFRAVHTLTTPITHFNAALGLALVPTFVGQATERQARVRAIMRLASAFFVGAALVSLAFVPFTSDVMALLYGEGFRAGGGALAVMLLGVPCMAATTVLVSFLRAERSSDRVLRGLYWSVAASVVIGMPTAAYWGSMGAGVGFALSQFAALLAMRYHIKSKTAGP